MAKASWKGLPKLKAQLIALKEKTRDDMKPALAGAADTVVAMARSLVPEDSGDLRNSIGWTWGSAPKGSISLTTAKVGNLRITIFAGNSTAYYARFVEFGTAPHKQGGQFKGTEHPGTAARPFFFPAYRASRKDIKRRIRKALRDAVQKAMR